MVLLPKHLRDRASALPGDVFITYEDSVGAITKRGISQVELDSDHLISAHCHLRDSYASFALKRIHHAIDSRTGEVIEDIYSYFGATPPPKLTRFPPPVTQPGNLSPEELRRMRSSEKQNLWRAAGGNKILIKVLRDRFFLIFDNSCFKCGSYGPLEVDHHVPIVLGGHLSPGNLVALCSRCNGAKKTLHPKDFYSEQRLLDLAPLLEKQKEVFDFWFDWERWKEDKKGYLIELGVDLNLVDEALNDEYSRYYVY